MSNLIRDEFFIFSNMKKKKNKIRLLEKERKFCLFVYHFKAGDSALTLTVSVKLFEDYFEAKRNSIVHPNVSALLSELQFNKTSLFRASCRFQW